MVSVGRSRGFGVHVCGSCSCWVLRSIRRCCRRCWRWLMGGCRCWWRSSRGQIGVVHAGGWCLRCSVCCCRMHVSILGVWLPCRLTGGSVVACRSGSTAVLLVGVRRWCRLVCWLVGVRAGGVNSVGGCGCAGGVVRRLWRSTSGCCRTGGWLVCGVGVCRCWGGRSRRWRSSSRWSRWWTTSSLSITRTFRVTRCHHGWLCRSGGTPTENRSANSQSSGRSLVSQGVVS